ncbi:hypothetical protein EV687_2115 [Corticibacter populi]|nr:hypothetical protein EV687_2115 [Corticibacter populi]
MNSKTLFFNEKENLSTKRWQAYYYDYFFSSKKKTVVVELLKRCFLRRGHALPISVE